MVHQRRQRLDSVPRPPRLSAGPWLLLLYGAVGGEASSKLSGAVATTGADFLRHTSSTRALQDETCERLLQLAYATDYQQSQDPCSCVVNEEGYYNIICSYGYCPDCVEGQCAIQSTSDYYTAAGQLQFQFGSYCLQYTSGTAQGTTHCFEFGRSDAVGRANDGTGLFCELRIDSAVCLSCSYTNCEDGVQPSFDCSNIAYTDLNGQTQYGPATDLCDPNDSVFPVDSPFAVFRQNDLTFEACYVEPTPTTTDPPTISRAASPTTEMPTSSMPTAVEAMLTDSPSELLSSVENIILTTTAMPSTVSSMQPPTSAATSSSVLRVPITGWPACFVLALLVPVVQMVL